jgi:hypothetical protein
MHLIIQYFNAHKQDVHKGVGIFVNCYQGVPAVLKLTQVHNALLMRKAGRSKKCTL